MDEADSYPLLNYQVNRYLEFGGEIKRIRSFTELEAWVKRVRPLVGELPNRAKSIRRRELHGKDFKTVPAVSY